MCHILITMRFYYFLLLRNKKYIPNKSEPIINVLSFVVVGIGEKTDKIVSPVSLALLIMATPARFTIVMLLWTISEGVIVVGKLSTIGFTVFLLLVLELVVLELIFYLNLDH